jgi:hypothetical protein
MADATSSAKPAMLAVVQAIVAPSLISSAACRALITFDMVFSFQIKNDHGVFSFFIILALTSQIVTPPPSASKLLTSMHTIT